MRKRKPRGAAFANFYTRRDLEKLLGISNSAISRMDKAGQIPGATYFGGVKLYRKPDVDAWLQEITLGEAKPSAPEPKRRGRKK